MSAQFRVFGRVSDEESGEVWWLKEETFSSVAEANEFCVSARRQTGRTHIVRGPGEPKPKDGYMEDETRIVELRAAFADMCREEQDAYAERSAP